jgi:hypothetical protein
MKQTLQDQYLLIKEGKGHKGVFLTEAKRQFPNIVRNAATFEEAAASLITKNIISENVVGMTTVAGYEPRKKESYETAFEDFLAEAKKKVAEDEKVKAEEKKVSKTVEEDLDKMHDNTDEKNPDNMIFDQIMMGYYAEMKDPKNAEKTMQQLKDIVFKNLSKDPIYYTKDGQFGVKGLGYTTEAPGLGEPKEPKGKYKSSGYGDLNEGKEKKKLSLKQIDKKDKKGLALYKNTENSDDLYYYDGKELYSVVDGDRKGPSVRMSLFDITGLNESIGRNYPGEIEGEYEGTPLKMMGSDMYNYLKDILDISNSEDDFIKKVIYGITDETSSISSDDENKLRIWYRKNSSDLGENLEKFKSDVKGEFEKKPNRKFTDEELKAYLKKKREEELERRKEAGEPLEEIRLREIIREIIDEELEEVRGGGNYGIPTINTSNLEKGERKAPTYLILTPEARKAFNLSNPGANASSYDPSLAIPHIRVTPSNVIFISDLLYVTLGGMEKGRGTREKQIEDNKNRLKVIAGEISDRWWPMVRALFKKYAESKTTSIPTFGNDVLYHEIRFQDNGYEVEKLEEWIDKKLVEIDKKLAQAASGEVRRGRPTNVEALTRFKKQLEDMRPNAKSGMAIIPPPMFEGIESLRESVEKDLAVINKEAEHEILQSKLDKIQGLIDKRQSQLGKLDEDEDMKALTDKKKVKDLEKDIKKLEAARKKVEKMMSKFKGKKKEVIDETDEMVDEEIPFNDGMMDEEMSYDENY